jgi:hypothetical protein
MEYEKAVAELGVLREFIDFVNKQVGVYCDCLAGFEGNKVRIERQVARVNYPTSKKIENGHEVVMWASVEDPSRPDVLHHRIIRTRDFIADNSEVGFNEQQMCRGIIVFIFAFWDEDIRPRIAKIRGVEPNEVKLDALGDLRTLRKSIIHNGGHLPATEYAKLKVLKDVCQPDAAIAPTHDQMHKIFVSVKNAIGRLILHYTGDLPGAPKPEEIVSIAIQNPPKRA